MGEGDIAGNDDARHFARTFSDQARRDSNDCTNTSSSHAGRENTHDRRALGFFAYADKSNIARWSHTGGKVGAAAAYVVHPYKDDPAPRQERRIRDVPVELAENASAME